MKSFTQSYNSDTDAIEIWCDACQNIILEIPITSLDNTTLNEITLPAIAKHRERDSRSILEID